jgi:hypothetical protein
VPCADGGSRCFAPSRLKSAALTDTVHGVYLPCWTFDAQGHADWTAESGYYYYTTETYRDSNGEMRAAKCGMCDGNQQRFSRSLLRRRTVCASRGVNEVC